VRFFRMAERRIVERTGEGVICYITPFSYLSDPSFVVMRQHLLEGFDDIWIDSLNGDSRRTGKLTPDGKPDPSVFSTPYNKEGIQVGTAISLLVRKQRQRLPASVRFRQFWGVSKRADLVGSLPERPFGGPTSAPLRMRRTVTRSS
jgi:predicted helicase